MLSPNDPSFFEPVLSPNAPACWRAGLTPVSTSYLTAPTPRRCASMRHTVWGHCLTIFFIGFYNLHASLRAQILGLWKQFEPQYSSNTKKFFQTCTYIALESSRPKTKSTQTKSAQNQLGPKPSRPKTNSAQTSLGPGLRDISSLFFSFLFSFSSFFFFFFFFFFHCLYYALGINFP